MRTRLAILLIFAALLGLALASAQAPNSPGSFQKDLLVSFQDAENKVMSLAKAEPAEKFSWRPGTGVRSVGEVYVHIANGNRLLLTLMRGMPARDEFMKMVRDNEQREKTIAEKSKVMADLESSFKEVHSALDNATEEALSRSIKFFGEDTTPRGVYITINAHVSEHLGQSIAYARMNGIVPPWSAPERRPII
jgi:uncharacterized damage-inducible protein DinB